MYYNGLENLDMAVNKLGCICSEEAWTCEIEMVHTYSKFECN